MRLSPPLDQLRPRYEVLVIGSGYGAAVSASRFARMGRRVGLLERGREFRPGEFPRDLLGLAQETHLDHPRAPLGRELGLLAFRAYDDVQVVQGVGLGGTSLINANVAVRPDPRVFEQDCWPEPLRRAGLAGLAPYYERACAMLQPRPYPRPLPRKGRALFAAGRALGHAGRLADLVVQFEDGLNPVGVRQRACNDCGDCCSGCNLGAKNTLALNYLPDAVAHGAELFTCAAVRWLERDGDEWVVHFQELEVGRERFDGPELTVRAPLVVLGASSLGSTEILLRSRAHGLGLSDRLGTGFTGNADAIAFAYNTDTEVNGVGYGSHEPAGREPVGPCITGLVDLRDTPRLDDGWVLEEGAVPGGLGPVIHAGLAASQALVGSQATDGDRAAQLAREAETVLLGCYHGATRHTLVYLVMGHDDAGGRMTLVDDRLTLTWPAEGRQPRFGQVADALLAATAALGGSFVPNPLWSRWCDWNVVTVHPLGGCPLGESAASGVVNDRGQVFSGTTGEAVHAGLYVADGAVLPRSLGANPFLTITALAERLCALAAADHGWTLDLDRPQPPVPFVSPVPAPASVGLRFTERLAGTLAQQPCDGVLTITAADLERFLADPAHEARLVGTLSAAALGPEPLTVHDGRFNLFVPDPTVVGAKRMEYRGTVLDSAGRTWRLAGYKAIHDDRGFDTWADTTTVYLTLTCDDGAALSGVLTICPADFLRQLRTMEVLGAPHPAARLAALARFQAFFAGALAAVYGGVLAPRTWFDPAAPPRARRPLRVGAPQVHACTTDDGHTLRLTRYHGGARGPLLLVHGLGVSSGIFSLDTLDTNLTEYLCAHGYDVWLVDLRASIALPYAAHEQFTVDDVAMHDLPAAVAAVRALTGAADLQVVAHCMGAMAFMMAQLSGLRGVRAAVCSQVGAHLSVPWLTRVKGRVHLGRLLRTVGLDHLDADVNRLSAWPDRLVSTLLRWWPVPTAERCADPVCERITFIYNRLYEHAQLDSATHAALHELFGRANSTAIDHYCTMIRAGRVVRADGTDAYLPHLDRAALPVRFIHGGRNRCFLPASTARTLEALTRANGPLYDRVVFPEYGHLDCLLGQRAASDVYPAIVEHLDRFA